MFFCPELLNTVVCQLCVSKPQWYDFKLKGTKCPKIGSETHGWTWSSDHTLDPSRTGRTLKKDRRTTRTQSAGTNRHTVRNENRMLLANRQYMLMRTTDTMSEQGLNAVLSWGEQFLYCL